MRRIFCDLLLLGGRNHILTKRNEAEFQRNVYRQARIKLSFLVLPYLSLILSLRTRGVYQQIIVRLLLLIKVYRFYLTLSLFFRWHGHSARQSLAAGGLFGAGWTGAEEG